MDEIHALYLAILVLSLVDAALIVYLVKIMMDTSAANRKRAQLRQERTDRLHDQLGRAMREEHEARVRAHTPTADGCACDDGARQHPEPEDTV